MIPITPDCEKIQVSIPIFGQYWVPAILVLQTQTKSKPNAQIKHFFLKFGQKFTVQSGRTLSTM